MTDTPQLTSASRVLIVAAALVVVLAGIKAASVVVVPVLLALFIAIICQPVILWFTRLGLPRFIAVLPVVGLIAIVGVALVGLIVQSVNEFAQKMPEYRDSLMDQFTWLEVQAERFNIQLNWDFLQAQFDPSRALNITMNMLSGVGGMMTSFFITLLIVVFMLAETRIMNAKVRMAFKSPERTLVNVGSILHAINKYLALKTAISIATGLIVGVGLWLMNIDHYLLWGVLAFMFNYIPNIGSILAAFPAVLMALIQHSPAMAGLVALLYLVVNTVMGNLLEPRVMGRGLGLSTLVVFVSLIFWGWMLGPVGMLLSVPLTMVVKIALAENESTRWMAIMLSGDEIMRAADNQHIEADDVVVVDDEER
ncbi:AI-2E family transporter [Aliidiomarina sp. Khilg15.8]